VGEVAEGAERLNDAENLENKFINLGLNEQLGWYARSMKYPNSSSVGFGVGLERLAMWLFGLNDIRELNPIYRDEAFSENEGQRTEN